HLHFVDFLEQSDGFPALCAAMDQAGVSQAIIFGMPIAKQWDGNADEPPSYYLSNDSRCYYYSATDYVMAEELLAQPQATRERFYPFCCGINGNDRFAAAHLEQALRLYPQFWSGIGELMSRHDDLTALTYGEPPRMDAPGFLDVYDLAAREGLPVLVHHNLTAQNTERILYLYELKRALAYNRHCKFIWAHIGISRRVEVKGLSGIADALLRDNRNLWVDISWLVYDYYFLDGFPSRFLDGDSLDDWAALIERHPDRFLIGTDKVGHWASYPAEVVKYYALLDKLRPATVARVCRDNALSLVKTY
ncbi:MAG: amidohydrolase, partial [Planctomycetes bacterium]|nr:amidohydrolase [Planctomycetota bacterium]